MVKIGYSPLVLRKFQWVWFGSIGSYFTNNIDKDIILITGDGGLQMNIQELQSVIHHQIYNECCFK